MFKVPSRSKTTTAVPKIPYYPEVDDDEDRGPETPLLEGPDLADSLPSTEADDERRIYPLYQKVCDDVIEQFFSLSLDTSDVFAELCELQGTCRELVTERASMADSTGETAVETDDNLFDKIVDYCAHEARQILHLARGKPLTESMKAACVKWIGALSLIDGMLRTQYRLHTRASAQGVARAWALSRVQGLQSGGLTVTPPSGNSMLSHAGASGPHPIACTCLGKTDQLPHKDITVVHKQHQGEVVVELGYKSSAGLGMLMAALANESPAGHGKRETQLRSKGVKITFSAIIEGASKLLLLDHRINMRMIHPEQGTRAPVLCRTVDELSRFVAYLIGAQHLLDSAPFTDIPKHIWGLLYSPLSTGTDLVARCETAIARMKRVFDEAETCFLNGDNLKEAVYVCAGLNPSVELKESYQIGLFLNSGSTPIVKLFADYKQHLRSTLTQFKQRVHWLVAQTSGTPRARNTSAPGMNGGRHSDPVVSLIQRMEDHAAHDSAHRQTSPAAQMPLMIVPQNELRELQDTGASEFAVAREVLSHVYLQGPYGPWTSIWVVIGVAWWSGQTHLIDITCRGVSPSGEITKPEYQLLPGWVPPEVPFAAFAWTMTQMIKFLGGDKLGFSNNDDDPLIDTVSAYTYAALCDVQEHLSTWKEERMEKEKDLCAQRSGYDIMGVPNVKEWSDTNQVMHGEYAKFLLDPEVKEMQLQLSPADCTLWCAPGTECATFSCSNPLQLGAINDGGNNEPSAAISRGNMKADNIKQAKIVFTVLPPCPDTILKAVRGKNQLKDECDREIEDDRKSGRRNKNPAARHKTLENVVKRIMSGHNAAWKTLYNHTKYVTVQAKKKDKEGEESILAARDTIIGRHKSLHQGTSPCVLFHHAICEVKAAFIADGVFPDLRE